MALTEYHCCYISIIIIIQIVADGMVKKNNFVAFVSE